MPIFTYSLNYVQSEYSATLSLIDASNSTLQIGITTLKDIPPFIPGISYYQFFNPTSIFQGLSLVSALLIAWPVDTLKARFFLFLTSFPLSFILLMLNIPFQIASSFDSTFSKLARINDLIRPEQIYQPWVLFIANGGNYILVIILVVFATQLQKRLFS